MLSPSRARLESLVTTIVETPAPTFAERERGELIARLLRDAGAAVDMDAVGNVVAHLPAPGPRIALVAHLDTVFPAGTDVAVRSEDGRWSAPGIGDNSASLAVLVHWVERVLADGGAHANVLVAATVGEEGLGDLKGARHLVDDVDMDAFVAVDGHLGSVVDRAVGSKRLRVEMRATGGHSWGDYPAPSAVHAVGDAIHALNRMPVPREPRSSYNVGEVSGGRSINAIAEEAWFNLDLRSVDADVLHRLEAEARKRLRRVARAHGVSMDVRVVGDRPTATVDNAWLVRAAKQALGAVGERATVVASSTDANAALAAGVPAIAFGVYRGGDAHRASEWLDPESLSTGFQALATLVGVLGESLPGGVAQARKSGSSGE